MIRQWLINNNSVLAGERILSDGAITELYDSIEKVSGKRPVRKTSAVKVDGHGKK